MPSMPPDFDPTAWPRGNSPPKPVPSHSDFVRLEERVGSRIDRMQEHMVDRLDKIADAMQQLVALQAEIGHQDRRLDAAEAREAKRDDREDRQDERINALGIKLDRWINRGVGAWGVVILAWTLWERVYGR